MRAKSTKKKTAKKSSDKTKDGNGSSKSNGKTDNYQQEKGKEKEVEYSAECPSDEKHAHLWQCAKAVGNYADGVDQNGRKYGFEIGEQVDALLRWNYSIRELPDLISQILRIEKPSPDLLFNCQAAYEDKKRIDKLSWKDGFAKLRWSVIVGIARCKSLSVQARNTLYKAAIQDVDRPDVTNRFERAQERLDKMKGKEKKKPSDGATESKRPKEIRCLAKKLSEGKALVGKPTRTDGYYGDDPIVNFAANGAGLWTADLGDDWQMRIGDKVSRVIMSIDYRQFAKELFVADDEEIAEGTVRLAEFDDKAVKVNPLELLVRILEMELDKLNESKAAKLTKKTEKKNADKKKATATVVKKAMASQAKQGKKSKEMEWTDSEPVPVS